MLRTLLLAMALIVTATEVAARPSRRAAVPLRIETTPRGPLAPPAHAPHAGAHGSTIVVDRRGLLVVERTVGAVVRCGRDGAPTARLDLSPDLGEIVSDGAGLVFVADRRAGRVLKLADSDELTIAGSVAVDEPYGLALSPDGARLAVTSVAEHALVVIDTVAMTRNTSRELGAYEPRGVAFTSDATRVAISFLGSGVLGTFALDGPGGLRWHGLGPPGAPRGEAADRASRGAWAVGVVGDDRLVVPHNLATPRAIRSGAPPITRHLAFVQQPGTLRSEAMSAQIDVHQPRALAYAFARDTLYIGGHGDDRILAVAEVSQQTPRAAWIVTVASDPGDACGLDGLAVDGDTLWAHCELSRRTIAVDLAGAGETPTWRSGPALTPDARDPRVARGAALFRRGRDPRLSVGGAMACADCHPEGRADGLTWRMGQSEVQTPILAGRVQQTAPYGWYGQYPDLHAAVRGTVHDLGGRPAAVTGDERDALVAYLESLPRTVGPALDREVLQRGGEKFLVACGECHGAPRATDGKRHTSGAGSVDTPSLLGVGHSAPYFHDGSVPALSDAARDLGGVHERMGVRRRDAYADPDLLAYLRSL